MDELGKFYETSELPFQLFENEYLIIYDEENLPTYYCYEKGKLRPFKGGSIKTIHRTMLRYAIEKMSDRERQEWMSQ